jgi:class 3 adenylate cyclase/Cdc6-like AAA superfamily ATPase
MDWCEWFGFDFDPFFDKPLETDQEIQSLMIVEKKMEEQVRPLIRQMVKMPFLCLISGERGIGKSTVIYYSTSLARKASYLSTYVSLDHAQLEFSGQTTYEITKSLMYELGAKLLDSIVKFLPSFFSENRNLLSGLARYLGLTFHESEGFVPSGEPYRLDFFELKRYILAIANHLKKADIPILLAIDNLDKIVKLEILESFFGAPVAQSLFDDLRREGVSILIATDSSFLQIQKKKRSLNYLSQNISVDALSPTQMVDLIGKRVNHSNEPPPHNPLEEKAVIAISLGKKGITRDVLTESRNLCMRAFEHNFSRISEKFVLEGLGAFNESRIFYEILERGESLKQAAMNISQLAVISSIAVDEAVSSICAIEAGENSRVKSEFLKMLIDLDIIRPTVSEKYTLTNGVSDLFGAIKKSKWDLKDFLSWVFTKDSMRVLLSGMPGVNAIPVVNEFGPIPPPRGPAVDIIVGGTQERFRAQDLLQEAIRNLEEAKQIASHVGALTWDDIDNARVYSEVYRALFGFLHAFCMLYICCASLQMIRVKSLDHPDFIENAVHHFQEEYEVSFRSFYRFLHFRANINGLARGGFSPSHSDVKAAFDDFTSVVQEFTSVWRGISSKFLALEIPDHEHGEILNEVVQCALLMGYVNDRPELRRFEIDGEKYFKLGFSKFTLNEASVDLVRERSTFDRFDHSMSYFLISSVSLDSKHKADEREILAFVQKCKDLISTITESIETSKVAEGFPKFLLWYVSPFGFEVGINAVSRTVELPSQTQIMTLDRNALRRMILQLRLPKRLPAEGKIEESIDELQKKDLEQLLRMRLQVSQIIQEKFEKNTTIVLADMKDFTERTEGDPLESAEAVQKMSDILKKNVERYGGWGTNSEGDSFIACFENPAHAVFAALKSIQEITEYNEKTTEKRRIYIRVGVSSGEILFKEGRPFIGDALNIAARIMKPAEPNRVIVSEFTHKEICAYRGFEFVDKGPTPLKGIKKPVQIYEARLKESVQ